MLCVVRFCQCHSFEAIDEFFPAIEEEEEESFYTHVPSPIGLIGWNINVRHVLNIQHMPKVFEGVTCPSRALPPIARTIDIARSIILLLDLEM